MNKIELEQLVSDYNKACDVYNSLHKKICDLVLEIATKHNLVWDRRFICNYEIDTSNSNKILLLVYDSDRDCDSATLSFDEIINPSLIDARLERERIEKREKEEQQQLSQERVLYEKLKIKFETKKE